MKILTKEWAERLEQVNKLYETKDFKQANKLLKEVECKAQKAKQLTETAEYYLSNGFILDDVVYEFVKREYSQGRDFFINVSDFNVCIENYQILERENFKIKDTYVYSAELIYNSNKRYELHLLLVNVDKYANKKYWYFTLMGTNIKFVGDHQ